MSATAIRIDRLRARFAVPDGSDAHRRLDGVLRGMLDSALEGAVERAGVGVGDELVCIRAVHVPIVLGLEANADAALEAAWAAAIADELARAAGPGVVRYGSRRQAVVDVACGVASGRLERVWAWRDLGLWPAGGADAVAALVELLVAEPEAIAPVLRDVARVGALDVLATRIDAAGWRALAIAALRVAGAPPEVAVAAVADHAPTRVSPTPATHRVARAMQRSPLTAPLRAAGLAPRVIAALAICAAEPSAIPDAGDDLAPAVAEAVATLTDAPVAEAPAEPASVAVHGGDGAEADAIDEPPLPDRPTATSEWGGLAFLLHALDDLDLPSRLTAPAPAAEARPPGDAAARRSAGDVPRLSAPLDAALHALALRLVPAAADDPAVLLFAGLAPDAEPPEDHVDIDLDPVVADVDAWLADRLEPPEPPLDRHAVLRRRAEVVADQGWFEVRLELAEVDVDVRRAGLDLDPGWLPPLGCVVRIVYA